MTSTVMYATQVRTSGDVDGSSAPLSGEQPVRRRPLRTRPVIGLLASSSTLAEGQWPVVSTDAACIDAVLSAGGDVRLVPIRLPQRGEDALEILVQTVLEFDGLVFAGSSSDVDPHLYGKIPEPKTAKPEPLLDWWVMLMTLVAHETHTPLFGVCGGAQRLNVALGGTLSQEIAGHRAEQVVADNWKGNALAVAPEMLTRCLRAGTSSLVAEDVSPGLHEIWCMHHQGVDILAPGLLSWGWSGRVMEGFGYPGPKPWFVLATMFHAEARMRCGDPLSRFLFGSYLQACRVYASERREEVNSWLVRSKVLQRLVENPLAQRFLQGPARSRKGTTA